jgi:Reverse transcriptase (RNA-dependent DNA polymerase)
MVNCAQINMGKRKNADREIDNFINQKNIEILFIQEQTYTTKNRLKGGQLYTRLIQNNRNRSAIWVKNSVNIRNPLLLNHLSDSDTTTILIETFQNNQWTTMILTSIYMPHYSSEPSKKLIKDPINQILKDIVKHAKDLNLKLLICSDTNSRHQITGDQCTNTRGEFLINFLLNNNLTIQNQHGTVTRENSIIDLTITNNAMNNYIKNWNIENEFIYSDHKMIGFKILSTKHEMKQRNIRKVNWNKNIKITDKAIRNHTWKYKNTSDIENSANKLIEIMIESLNLSAKLKSSNQIKNYKKPSKKLKNRKKKVLQDYRVFKNNKTEESKNTYKNTLKQYEQERNIEERLNWKKFTEKIDSVEATAKLRKIMENKGKNQPISSMIKHNNTYTKNIDETTDLLMETHFPSCKKIDQNQQIDTRLRCTASRINKSITDLINEENIIKALNEFGRYKSPGPDGIYPIQLQNLPKSGITVLKDLLTYSLHTNYIPKKWLDVEVTFINKPGKKAYDTPKSFRPISLMSFFTKTMEKILNKKIRDDLTINNNLFDPDQHAYQEAKGCDTAILNVTTRIKKALENKEYMILTSIDFEGAFDNCNFNNIEQVLKEKEVEQKHIKWIMDMLKNRNIKTRNLVNNERYTPTKGTPQGSVISPLIWNLLIDKLIKELKSNGFQVTVYADDIIISISGNKKLSLTVKERMNEGLKIIHRWCTDNGINISSEKSNYMEYNKPTINKKLNNPPVIREIKLNGKVIQKQNYIKYLGIILDDKLNWNEHVKYIVEKARKTYWATKSFIASNWGLNPLRIKWIYDQVVLPRITYGSIGWWEKCNQITANRTLNKIKNTFLRAITGSTKTSPIEPIQTIMGIPDMTKSITNSASLTYLRLKNKNLWTNNHSRFNNIEELTLKLDIPTYLSNKSQNKIKPEFHIISKDRPPANYKSRTKSPNKWYLSMKTHKKGIKIAYSNPHQNISEGMFIVNCKDSILGFKQLLSIILPKNRNDHTTFFIDNQYIIKKMEKGGSEILNDEIESLNNIHHDHSFTLKLQSSKNKYMATIHNWTNCPLIKNVVHTTNTAQSIKQWLKIKDIEEINEKWVKYNNNPYAKLNFVNHNPNLLRYILKCNKKEVKAMISIITGNGLFNRYRAIIGLTTDKNCRLCKNTTENAEHLLTNCPETEIHKVKHIKYKNNKFLSTTKPASILKFLKRSELIELLTDANYKGKNQNTP